MCNNSVSWAGWVMKGLTSLGRKSCFILCHRVEFGTAKAGTLFRLSMLRFDPEVEGGESIFVDGFEVAKDLRKQFPDDFNNLVRIPATFQKIHFERYLFLLLNFHLYHNY